MDRLNAWLNRVPVTKGNVELQKLIKEPLSVLTTAFVASLRTKAKYQPVLLLFDTYEKVMPETNLWLWQRLLGNNELLDVKVRLAIAGRNDILQQEGWRKLQQDRGFIYNQGVERFSKDLTKAYLWQIGIRDEDYFDRIYQITKGWPYYLNTICRQLTDSQNIESILARIDLGIEDLLLQESDVDKKRLKSQVSRIVACCRSFDAGLVKYLLDKLELPPLIDGLNCYEWLKEQHFFKQGAARLDDVARDVFRRSLWQEDSESFMKVYHYLAEYFKAKSDRYASPESSYVDKYENDDWLIARSEYLYHRMFAEQVDTEEFTSHLLESLYFRLTAIKLLQIPFQNIISESNLENHPFLSAQGRKLLTTIKPVVMSPWEVLEENPIDYNYSQRQLNLSKFEIDEGIKAVLNNKEKISNLAEFMRLYCKSKRCLDSDRHNWLMQAKNQIEQLNLNGESVEFICDLFFNKIAASLYAMGMYKEAIVFYDRVLNLNPDHHNALNDKGISLCQLDRYEEAIVAFDMALKIQPNKSESLNNKGIALKKLGKYEEAMQSYNLALQIKPDYPEALNNKGNVLEKLGKYGEAITAYNRAIEIKPDYYEAFYGKSFTLEKLGTYEEAITVCDRAIEIKPDYCEAFYGKGFTLEKLGKYEEAIAAYDRAIDIKPDYCEAFYSKGLILEKLDRDEEAIAAYDRAIEIKPDYYEAFYGKGFTFAKLGKYEEAIAAYDRTIEIKPDYPEALNNKGNVLEKLGKYEEAITAYNRAIEIKPDYYEAFYGKGFTFAKLGKYEEAIAAYDRAIEIKPDYCEAFYDKGNALVNLGRFEEGIVAYEQALVIKPNYHEAWDNRGYALFSVGRSEEAILSYDRSLKINPEYANAHYNKSCFLTLSGETDLAIVTLSTAINLEPKNRESARTDPDFDLIRNDERFKQLIADPNPQI